MKFRPPPMRINKWEPKFLRLLKWGPFDLICAGPPPSASLLGVPARSPGLLQPRWPAIRRRPVRITFWRASSLGRAGQTASLGEPVSVVTPIIEFLFLLIPLIIKRPLGRRVVATDSP